MAHATTHEELSLTLEEVKVNELRPDCNLLIRRLTENHA